MNIWERLNRWFAIKTKSRSISCRFLCFYRLVFNNMYHNSVRNKIHRFTHHWRWDYTVTMTPSYEITWTTVCPIYSTNRITGRIAVAWKWNKNRQNTELAHFELLDICVFNSNLDVIMLNNCLVSYIEINIQRFTAEKIQLF